MSVRKQFLGRRPHVESPAHPGKGSHTAALTAIGRGGKACGRMSARHAESSKFSPLHL